MLGRLLVLRISDMNEWVQGLSDWGYEVIAEAECSGQLNNVQPQDVMKMLCEAVKWLRKRRQWSAAVFTATTKPCMEGYSGSLFFHLPSVDFENLVYCSLMIVTFTQASGRVWDKLDTIPMDCPFNVQNADLQLVRGVNKCVELLCQLCTLRYGLGTWLVHVDRTKGW